MGWFRPPTTPGPEVTFRRSARARKMTLRVSRLDGRVTLTMPLSTSDRAAQGFVADHADWIAKAQSKTAPEIKVMPGGELPVENKPRRLQSSNGRQARIYEHHIDMPSQRALVTALKHLARERILPRVDAYAAKLDRPVRAVTLRDTRSRWGSCTSDGKLMFSWRLILAPTEVLDYVVAHEVAHLAEMNHSPAFWAEVAYLCPNYETPKKWLKTKGPDLHRYRFD